MARSRWVEIQFAELDLGLVQARVGLHGFGQLREGAAEVGEPAEFQVALGKLVMRVRILGIDLNDVLVLDDRFLVLAGLEVRIAPLRVFCPGLFCGGRARGHHQEQSEERKPPESARSERSF